MRWAAAFLALAFGGASAAAGEASLAESAPPAPEAPQAASRRASAPAETRRNNAPWDSTAITELTDEGRRLRAYTAERPAFFVTYSGGQHDFGKVPAGGTAPSAETLDQELDKVLGGIHYLRADARHPPTKLIIFVWGIHANPGENIPDPGGRNFLARAALVGGRKFAGELRQVLERNASSTAAASLQPWGAQADGMRPTSAVSLFQTFSPIETFRKRDLKTEHLLDQITNDCYYVVISAYDCTSGDQNQQPLLWRTKLTAVARGTAMAVTVPELIESGAEFLGREMNAAEFFSRRDR